MDNTTIRRCAAKRRIREDQRSEEKKADSDAGEQERTFTRRHAPKAQKEQGTEAYGDLENLLDILGAAHTSGSDSHPHDAE